MTNKPKNPWRPTKYNQDVLDKANTYLDNYADEGHVIPSVVGLADVLNVTAKTLYNWSDKKENKDFLHILERLNQRQHIRLISGGLDGSLNSQITKLVLGKHGYHDKVDTDVTSKGKKISNNFIIQPVITKTDG